MDALEKQSVWKEWINRSLREAGWAPMLVFVAHVIGLVAYDRYTGIPGLDIILHFIGGVVMAYFLHSASINASGLGILGDYHPLTHRLLIFTATCTVAVFWEFAEFILDATFGTYSQAGVVDTMSDLFFGVLGAGVFILLLTVIAADFDRFVSVSMHKVKKAKDAVFGD